MKFRHIWQPVSLRHTAHCMALAVFPQISSFYHHAEPYFLHIAFAFLLLASFLPHTTLLLISFLPLSVNHMCSWHSTIVCHFLLELNLVYTEADF